MNKQLLDIKARVAQRTAGFWRWDDYQGFYTRADVILLLAELEAAEQRVTELQAEVERLREEGV